VWGAERGRCWKGGRQDITIVLAVEVPVMVMVKGGKVGGGGKVGKGKVRCFGVVR
jgi:hypothetical protein